MRREIRREENRIEKVGKRLKVKKMGGQREKEKRREERRGEETSFRETPYIFTQFTGYIDVQRLGDI
jgi:hypothetical protein